MYILVRARYRQNKRSGRWVETNLANALIGSLSATYGDIYLYVQYPGTTEPIIKALNWNNIEDTLNQYDPNLTVQQWLTSIGNKTLPFDNALPNETIRLVKYAQAWHSGYDIQAVGAYNHVDQDISVHYKEDLLLTHPVHKPQVIRDNCLISVNGYYHLTDWTNAGVRIIDGNLTVLKGNDNQVGVYSFEKIGGLKFLPITDEMIKVPTGESMWNSTYLEMPPEIDITDKTVLLVTGGYLNVLSDVYERVGNRSWRLSFGRMQFASRIMQSLETLDLSSLGLVQSDTAPNLVSVENLKSDDVLKAYLKLSQSFFVIVDSASFFQAFEPVQYLAEPGRFIDGKKEQLPLTGSLGKMLDYHVITEPNQGNIVMPRVEQLFVFCASLNHRNDYDFHHRPWVREKTIDAGRYPAQPFKNETAYFRILGVEG